MKKKERATAAKDDPNRILNGFRTDWAVPIDVVPKRPLSNDQYGPEKRNIC